MDGCRPDEAAGAYLPTLRSLAAQGTSFAAAKSITVAETIPNHVAMMTGVYPDRSGAPANSVWDPALGVVRDLGLATDYLFGVFGGRAAHRWMPAPLLPITGHAPDVFTMGAVLDAIDEHDPALLFANLGDVDRFGDDPLLDGNVQIAQNGGADFLYWTGAPEDRAEAFAGTLAGN